MPKETLAIDVEKAQMLLRKRSKTLSLKVNPEMMKMIDRVVEKEKRFQSKTDFVENLLIKYFLEKGMI